jgi:hypothetical protein
VVVSSLEVVPCSVPFKKSLGISRPFLKRERFLIEGLRGATSSVVPSLETTYFGMLEDVI